MLRPRTRLISLRITQEEYDSIRQASAEVGARCVSEFARKALLESARPAPVVSTPAELSVCAVMAGLDVRLTRVEEGLAQVAGELHARMDETAGPGE